jgi:ABC-type antimicrobial peptide transport system permease subunit
MIKNYLKTAIRNILRHKVYSFLNVAGLAVGMACCILLLLWVRDELSYDRFHHNADRIYRVFIENTTVSPTLRHTSTPIGLAPHLRGEFPEIEMTTRLKIFDGVLLSFENLAFREKGFGYADAEIFKMFSFSFIKGNPETAFKHPKSIVINEEVAKKYFGDDDPLGRTLRIDKTYDLTVTGVIKKLPHNSTLQFDLLVPFSFLGTQGADLNSFRLYDRYQTYVMLKENVDEKIVDDKIAGIIKKHDTRSTDIIKIQPLTRVQLFGLSGDGKFKYVVMFSILAIFILGIACINFMNLTTARSETRSLEVGMRKVIGAEQKDLVAQFFGESIVLAFISLIIAVIIVGLLIPVFNNLSGKEITVGFFLKADIILGLIIIALLTGIISGSYPAFLLSAFKPLDILKSNSRTGSGRSGILRKFLVAAQFSLSILLIIGTISIQRQLNYIRNRDLGYDKEHIVYFPLQGNLRTRFEVLRTEMIKNANILGVSFASQLPTNILSETSGINWEGKDPNTKAYTHFTSVDHDFIKTFNMKILQGRDFSRDIGTDSGGAFVLNETAVKQTGLDAPVGKRFIMWGRYGLIIGVVKDFNFASMHNKINPLVLFINPRFYSLVFVRVKPGNISASIGHIEKTWNELVPGYPFEYNFLDDAFNSLYKVEQRMSKLFGYFSILAIFISCLGLLGLASFTAEQKTREIGIRKVLGASITNIVFMQSKEFLALVALANIIAWPLAFYFADKWLQDFAYRININVGSFVLAGLIALFIAMLTVSYQAIKAALANPVDALKYE